MRREGGEVEDGMGVLEEVDVVVEEEEGVGVGKVEMRGSWVV